MRIGLFSDSFPPEINGVAVATKALAEIMRKNGHDVYVVTTNPFSNKIIFEDNVLRLPGIRLKQLYDYRLTGFYNRKATQIIKKMNLDVIHVQTEIGVGIFGRMIAKFFDIPLVYTYHTMYIDYTYYVTKGHFDRTAKALVKKFSKSLADSCTEFTTTSEKTRDALRSYNIERYINVIPNGIDLAKFDCSKISQDEILKFKKENNIEDAFVLLALGRVAKEKSIDYLLKGYKEFLTKQKPENKRTVLLIVGDGPDRANLEVLTKELQIEDHVIFTGKIPYEQVPFYYAVANLYLSASISETQGLTFIEAMATSTLVLARYDENLANVIEDGVTGFFFNDKKSMCDKLSYILSLTPEEKKNIEKTALQADQRFSIDVYYQKMLHTYQRAIRKRW